MQWMKKPGPTFGDFLSWLLLSFPPERGFEIHYNSTKNDIFCVAWPMSVELHQIFTQSRWLLGRQVNAQGLRWCRFAVKNLAFILYFRSNKKRCKFLKVSRLPHFQRLIWEKRKSWKPSFSNDFFAILTILVCTLYTRNLIPNTEIIVPLLCSPHWSGRMGRVKKDIS